MDAPPIQYARSESDDGNTAMKFGVHLPHMGQLATRENLVRFAREADTLGFDSCWVADHIVPPQHVDSKYPYSATGAWTPSRDQPWLEPLATLLFVAGCTENVQLGTSVMVLGYRPPIQTAKIWTTLDTLSGGRAILGIGVGWMKEEFDALGMPFDHRGARADEMMEIYHKLFTEPAPSHDGRFYKFKAVSFEPKPVRGQIPIWVGGHSRPAYRRTARYGDVFQAVFVTPAELADQWAELQAACDAVGRDPATLGLSIHERLRHVHPEDEGTLSGSTDHIVEKIGRMAEMGVSHITMGIAAGDGGVDTQIEAMQRFMADVRPQVG
jgi:probable F420-dependent oxidoreductase